MDCEIWSKVASSVEIEFGVKLSENAFQFRVSDIGWEEDYGIHATADWIFSKYYRLLRSVAYSSTHNSSLKKLLVKRSMEWADNRFYIGRKVAEITGVEFVVDASKERLGMIDLYDRGTRNVKIIYLTRDVFGDVWSSIKGGKGNVQNAAMEWVKEQARILKLLEQVENKDYIHVKYENICSDPEKECESLR